MYSVFIDTPFDIISNINFVKIHIYFEVLAYRSNTFHYKYIIETRFCYEYYLFNTIWGV
jgi:hypothetical protein